LLEPDLSPLESNSNILDHIQPHALAAKSRANDKDNLSYKQAMDDPFHSTDYWQAAKTELTALQDDLNCWELVPFHKKMNVLASTWAFRCKRFPDRRVKKFKA
jgi:hypothetical protein